VTWSSLEEVFTRVRGRSLPSKLSFRAWWGRAHGDHPVTKNARIRSRLCRSIGSAASGFAHYQHGLAQVERDGHRPGAMIPMRWYRVSNLEQGGPRAPMSRARARVPENTGCRSPETSRYSARNPAIPCSFKKSRHNVSFMVGEPAISPPGTDHEGGASCLRLGQEQTSESGYVFVSFRAHPASRWATEESGVDHDRGEAPTRNNHRDEIFISPKIA